MCVKQSGCKKVGRGCSGDGSCLNGNKEYSTYEAALEQCNNMTDCEGVMQSQKHKQWVLRSATDPLQTEDVAQYCAKTLDDEMIE